MITLPGNIRLTISPYFWILVLLIGWINSSSILGMAIWAPVIFFSVLIHELGHALTARAFGQVSEIELVAYGGLTRRMGGVLKTWQEFLVVFNGPLAGFCLFVVAYIIQSFVNSHTHPMLAYALEITVIANLFWTFINLLPVLPLDGGHMMKVILEGAFGLKGTKISFLASLTFGVLLSIFFFLIQFMLAGALFIMLAFESYRSWSEFQKIREGDTNPELHRMLQQAQHEAKRGEKEAAIEKLKLLKGKTKEGALFLSSSVTLAQILADQGKYLDAYKELYPHISELSPTHLRLLQQWAFQIQKWDEALNIGKQSYAAQPSGQVALTNALCSAILGEKEAAIGWLRCAKQFNVQNWKDFLTKREFDVIRHLPEFQSIN